MRATALVPAILLAALSPVPALAQDYGVGPTFYYLHRASNYQEGCWGQCACPLTNREPVRGTFILSLISVGDATDFYSISSVQWTVPTIAGQGPGETIAGSGTFGAGQVPFATHQNMSLALNLNPQVGNVQPVQFATTPETSTRTVPPPVIDIEVSSSTTGCPGVRVHLSASRYRTDWNADGVLSVTDVFEFISDFFSSSADFDEDNTTSVLDIFRFINAWFAGT